MLEFSDKQKEAIDAAIKNHIVNSLPSILEGSDLVYTLIETMIMNNEDEINGMINEFFDENKKTLIASIIEKKIGKK